MDADVNRVACRDHGSSENDRARFLARNQGPANIQSFLPEKRSTASVVPHGGAFRAAC